MAGAERRRISTRPDVIAIRNYDGLRPRHALAKEGFDCPKKITSGPLAVSRQTELEYSLVGYVGPGPEPPAMGLSLEGKCMAPATADHELPCAGCSIAV